jgi:transposase
MTTRKYTAEFKAEAVKQVTERGHTISEVARRLGTTNKTLGLWVKKMRQAGSKSVANDDSLRAENVRLKAELKRTTEERDILKKATAYFARVSG